MFTKIRTHFLAKRRSRQSGGNPDRSTGNNGSKRELSSVGRGLFIRTFQFVLFAQVLLFVILLSIFERFQLQNAVASADLAGQFAVKILISRTLNQEKTGPIVKPGSQQETGDQGTTCAIVKPGGQQETGDQGSTCVIVKPGGQLVIGDQGTTCVIVNPGGQQETGDQGTTCVIVKTDGQQETGGQGTTCVIEKADGQQEIGDQGTTCVIVITDGNKEDEHSDEIPKMVEQTRDLLWKRYGVEPSRYRAYVPSKTTDTPETPDAWELIAAAKFVESSVGKITRTDTIDLEELHLYDHFLNASRRLLLSGEGVIVQLTNIKTMLPEVQEKGDIRVVIESAILDRSKLRSNTVDFVGTFLLQAVVVLLLVPLLMYFIGSRLITVPIMKLNRRFDELASDSNLESKSTSSEESYLREFRETEANLNTLRDRFEEFLNGREAVVHDVKDALIDHCRVAEGIWDVAENSAEKLEDLTNQFESTQDDNLKDRAKVAKEIVEVSESSAGEFGNLASWLTEMQRDTLQYMRDLFNFVRMKDPAKASVEIELRSFCRDLLDKNVHIRLAGSTSNAKKPTRLAIFQATMSVQSGLRVYGSTVALESIIRNLVSNSIKVVRKSNSGRTWKNSFLEIAAKQEHGVVTILVRDNGPGFEDPNSQDSSLKPALANSEESTSADSEENSWEMGLRSVKERTKRMHGSFRIVENPTPPKGSDTAGAEIELKLPSTAEVAERMAKDKT